MPKLAILGKSRNYHWDKLSTDRTIQPQLIAQQRFQLFSISQRFLTMRHHPLAVPCMLDEPPPYQNNVSEWVEKRQYARSNRGRIDAYTKFAWISLPRASS